MYTTNSNNLYHGVVLKYRVTAAHFTPIGLQCSKIALTRSFYTSSVAIAVRKLVGAEHEDVVTYEKSSEWLARPFGPVFPRGSTTGPEMYNASCQCKTSLLDFIETLMMWKRVSNLMELEREKWSVQYFREQFMCSFESSKSLTRQEAKNLTFADRYGASSEIFPTGKGIRNPIDSVYLSRDFGSLERRVSNFVGSSHV